MQYYDEFGFEIDPPASPDAAAEEVEVPRIPIRTQFPEAGEYLGGHSDGWEYRTVFAGSNLDYSYRMVLGFLEEEGYGDVPVPASAADLKLFRRPRGQLQLFSERGYIHNPIKILFPDKPKQRGTLILCLYNEQAAGHLLRFHGVGAAFPGGG
jgi:hypothetical protein